MRIVGLDMSLTATGIADSASARVFKPTGRGMPRLELIRAHIDYVVRPGEHVDGRPIVLIEGYSYASANQAHQLGELGGVIRLYLHSNGVTYIDVPPSSLKKFATGKGNANKSAMGLAAARHGYDGPGDDNAIDAWWLRQMGLYRYGTGLTIPAGLVDTDYRAEACSKIEWPNAS